MKLNIEIQSKEGSDYLESDLIPDNQEIHGAPISDSDRRILEKNRRGIFACPRYSDFFQNQDEIRME